MKLYLELKKQMNAFHLAYAPLLMRYAVMEDVAAVKILQNKPIFDPEREQLVLENIRLKCVKYGYEPYKIEVIQQFFIHNMTIAKLIQEAFVSHCHGQSKESILACALVSTCEITGQTVEEKNLLGSIREFIDGLTDEIMTQIDHLTHEPSYQLLKELIEKCFDAIDKKLLGNTFDLLIDEMNRYQKILEKKKAQQDCKEKGQTVSEQAKNVIKKGVLPSELTATFFYNNTRQEPVSSPRKSLHSPPQYSLSLTWDS